MPPLLIDPALASTLVLVGALALFVSERVRYDLVALVALFATLLLGLVSPSQAFLGFADPAVITVAAVLVIGRAIELSGAAAAIAQRLIPERAPFTVSLAMVLVVGAFLSAFMNNIAALVITMPLATDIARRAKVTPAATLMPLAFATILGGTTTLIGTPANLIISSARDDALGAPLGFFTMTPVAAIVCLLGIAYIVFVGWRLLPVRSTGEREVRAPWRVFELTVPFGSDPRALGEWKEALRTTPGRLLALFRTGQRLSLGNDTQVLPGDRLLLLSRLAQSVVADKTGLAAAHQAGSEAEVTARAAVAHGSFLIGISHEDVRLRSDGRVRVVAVGPRAAREKVPLAMMRIQAGDQLFIRGEPKDLAEFIGSARLLEIDRLDQRSALFGKAFPIVGIFAFSILLVVLGVASAAVAFVGAALVLALLRLIPTDESYSAIEWPVIVLLGAMIPVGQSFETSGAAEALANWLAVNLVGLSLFWVLAAMTALTVLLSMFINNVACAVIVAPLGIGVARLLNIDVDAMLIAILIGTSADFLTPIGHQNNALVMGPGGYRFTDYARMGAPVVLIVVFGSAGLLSALYG